MAEVTTTREHRAEAARFLFPEFEDEPADRSEWTDDVAAWVDGGTWPTQTQMDTLAWSESLTGIAQALAERDARIAELLEVAEKRRLLIDSFHRTVKSRLSHEGTASRHRHPSPLRDL